MTRPKMTRTDKWLAAVVVVLAMADFIALTLLVISL